jgi:putative spermidine/putrescine transport system ATP-binding protein
MAKKSDTRPASASVSRVSTDARPGEPGLHNVSIAIARGEVLALLGVGGAPSGTSTVLQLFAGFARPTNGQVQIGGRMMDATPPHRRGIGVVTKRLSLFPHLDAIGHARFAPSVTAAQADLMLQHLGLQAFGRRRWQVLSPELQFRIALARALAPAPRLLLLEDPFPALPNAAAAPLKSLLRNFAAEADLSILMTTEEADSCYGLADRIAVLQSGILRQIGPPQELYENPCSLAVAQSLGPLNKIAGSVVDIEDDIAAVRLTGGALVEARFVGDLHPGEACIVALRPERIAVAAINIAEMSEGAVPAHLIETVFTGNLQTLRFSIDTRRGTAPEILVTRPSGAALPRSPEMCLAWQPHHARAFRADTA